MSDPAPLIQVVEDDEAVRGSLEALLEVWGFAVEPYPDGEAYLATARPDDAHAILLDVRLPGQDGLEVLRSLRAAGVHTPVIILTGHGDVPMAVQALRDGADDFIEKPFDDADLVQRIDAAARRQQAEAAPQAPYLERIARLTPRESDVMREVVAGHPNKIVAHRLGLSPKTVEIHRARVMDKTGVRSLSELVRLALKAGIDPEDNAS